MNHKSLYLFQKMWERRSWLSDCKVKCPRRTPPLIRTFSFV